MPTYKLEIPKPMKSTTEMQGIASPEPSDNQKPDSALIALEHHHGASPTPDNLVVNSVPQVLGMASPEPSDNHEPDSALVALEHHHGASPAPDNLVVNSFPQMLGIANPEPSDNHEPDSALVALEHHHGASPALVVNPVPQETDAASSNPVGFDALALSTGPPENQIFDVAAGSALDLAYDTGPHDSQEFAEQAPQPLQHQRSGVEARVIPEGVLMARTAILEKERMIKEKDDMIEFLRSEVSD